MTITTVGLGFVAGALSILSPCVLPMIPVVFGAAATEHRAGPFALAAGVAIAFSAIGLFVATIGFAIGLDAGVFRAVSAVMLLTFGIILVLPRLQTQLAVAAGPVGAWADKGLGGFSTSGVGGQFLLGLLLGTVWSPCVGPTLGAASLMAARGENLFEVGLVMLAFGVGAAAPLLILGIASREAMVRWRNRLRVAGANGKAAFGALLVIVGLLILTNLDKRLEAYLVDMSPDWLTALTTSI